MKTPLLPLARSLRSNQTDAEHMLWKHIRAGRFEGYKFKRQQPLGHYIVDFVCFEAMLVIELDGGQHAEQVNEDAERTLWLASQGFRVLRFWNNEVIENMEGMWASITTALSPSGRTTSHSTKPASGQVAGYPQPSPLKGEGVKRRTK